MSEGFPDTPVGRQLAWAQAHFGPGALEASQVEEHFAPSFLQAIPVGAVVSVFAELEDLAEASVERIDGSDYELHALLRAGNETVRVGAQVETESPHRFLSVWFDSGPDLFQVLDETEPARGPLSNVVAEKFGTQTKGIKAGGVVVGVVRQEEEDYFVFGDVPEEGIFEVGSITKPFTGILLAEMASRGELALEDPVRSHLPEDVIVPRRGERQIALADLATHTSGLPRLPPEFEPRDPSNPYADFTVENLYAALARTELLFETGTAAEYSNFAFGLLGHLLELISGIPYSHLLEERICEPLKLTDTFIDISPTQSHRRVLGYDSSGKQVPHWDPGAILGAGGIQSSIQDMVRFVKANLEPPERGIGEALTSAQHPRVEREERHRMGLGWNLLARTDSSVVTWKNGGTGGFESSCAFHRPSEAGVVALSNSSGVDIDAPVLSTLTAISPIRG